MMDFDDYFESHESKLPLDENIDKCLEAMEVAILKLGLQPSRATSPAYDMLMKPLPPIPEDVQENRWMAAREKYRTIGHNNITPSECRIDAAARSPLRKARPDSRAVPDATAQTNFHTSNFHDTATRNSRPATSNGRPHGSPRNHINTTSLIESPSFGRIDMASAEFDSVDSRESAELDRWADEIYGCQITAMSSLRRQSYGKSFDDTSMSRTPASESSSDWPDESTWSSVYRLSTYSTAHTNTDYSSSKDTREYLRPCSDRELSRDTIPISVFDFSDDEADPLIKSGLRPRALHNWRVNSSPAVNPKTPTRAIETPTAQLEDIPARSGRTSRFSASLRLLCPMKSRHTRQEVQLVPAAVSSPKARKILGLKS